MHALPALITILAVLHFIAVIFLVGRARGKYKVPAPFTDGPEGFVRAFRVQQNSMEQLIAFLPSLWLFAVYLKTPQWAGAIGGVWLLGRVWYAVAYSRGANRFPGFVLGMVSTMVLCVGALAGILMNLLGL